MRYIFLFLMIFAVFSPSKADAQVVQFAKSGVSAYEILLAENASSTEIKAAEVLQHYFYEVTRVKLSIARKPEEAKLYIVLKKNSTLEDKGSADGFTIKNDGKQIVIKAGTETGTLYGVYYFVRTLLNCKKWAPNEKAECPKIPDLKIQFPLNIVETPAFAYREVYSTAENDQEYMDWYGLHQLDELWGLWGHSFSKLVPSSFFGTHPEYFALVDGQRRTDQLCLSNEDVLKITLENLNQHFKNNPAAKYWSVSPNDNNNFCECELCRKTDDEEGGPQGSLIRFVNKIAAHYPEKTFTTLAYGATLEPPQHTKPRANVIIFLSNIDLYRNQPVATEPSAARFRNILKSWLNQTSRIFIWDYYTQFTNYLAPFPDAQNIGVNIDYYKKLGVAGVFAQMGGNSYVDQNELKTYLLSRKLWNATLNDEQLLEEFLQGYYGNAAPLIKDYMLRLKKSVEESGRRLDIYGNPVNEYNSYLSPNNMEDFSNQFDAAEKLAENSVIRQRIQKLRLAFDFTYLQQARFYGLEKHGVFTENPSGKLSVRKDLPLRVKRFVKKAEAAGVKKLSEGGIAPAEYLQEWKKVFENGLIKNKALGAKVQFHKPFVPEFPAKKEATLTDGMYGFKDFSYNWLLFESGFSATLDLSTEKQVEKVTIDFLEDQRHWIFLPASVIIQVSTDGIAFQEVNQPVFFILKENDTAETHKARFSVGHKVRFIKISAEPLQTLPAWKPSRSKKPLIAISEIWVE